MGRKSSTRRYLDIDKTRQTVWTGLQISQRITDLLEQAAPQTYHGGNRAQTIRMVNDMLQGRTIQTVDDLLSAAEQVTADRPCLEGIDAVRRDAQAFLRQRARMNEPYTKIGDRQYQYEIWDADPGRPLKLIDQALYDRAREDGFPPGFFRESHFNGVTLTCLPSGTDCNLSSFQDCIFVTCRIADSTFDGAHLNGCSFHTVELDHVTFCGASIAHTHFHDSTLNWVSFQRVRMKSCNTIDCQLKNVGFLYTTLDGCAYGRISAQNIRQLETATITMGGATAEECAANRKAILRSLDAALARQYTRGKRQSGR